MKQSISSKHPFVSSKEATKGGSSEVPTDSKSGPSKNRKESSSAKNSNPNYPSAPTPVVAELYKEDQQAVGVPTSLGGISEEGAHPQLSSEKTKSVSDRLDIVLTKPKIGLGAKTKSSEENVLKEIKFEDLAKLGLNVATDFMDLDSLEDDSVIVVNDNKDDEDMIKDDKEPPIQHT
ncbi:hypothetical protein Tco_1132480, partial [Tanacetum coccineum]